MSSASAWASDPLVTPMRDHNKVRLPSRASLARFGCAEQLLRERVPVQDNPETVIRQSLMVNS